MNRRGFTLIEILATITIATIMIGAIFPLLSIGSKGIYKSSDRTYAVLAAADLIEVVRGTDFDVLPPRGQENPYTVDEIKSLINAPEHQRSNLYFNHIYEKKFAIGIFVMSVESEGSEIESKNRAEIRQVVVKVQWKSVLDQSPDGKIEEIELTSLYTENKSS